MRRGFIVGLSLATGLMVAFAAANAVALNAREIVGTWTPVSNPPYGDNPKGIVMFDAHGHFAIELFRADVPRYASSLRTEGTPEEYEATVEGSLAYFGTYKVRGTDLLLHVESSTFPNWNGADQRRTNLTIKGDKLMWTQPAPSGGGGPAATVWQRLK